jgi:hypothetical protein
MAAELKREDDDTIILAMHPGEVATLVLFQMKMWERFLTAGSDMANIEIPWDVDGVMTAEQSVSAMLPVIQSKGIQHSGTFWTWENKASYFHREQSLPKSPV